MCSPLDSGWGTVIAILSIVVLRILIFPVRAVTAVAIIIDITVTAVVVGITGSVVAVGALFGNRQLVQFEASDGSCVSWHHKTTFACVHIPDAQFAIAASRDQHLFACGTNAFNKLQGPYTTQVALQCPNQTA